MASRISALRRIEGLYGLIETVHAGALERAAATVREAEIAIAAQTELKRTARADAQTALSTGDRERWAVAEIQRGHSEGLRASLKPILEERERAADEARAVYNASRIRRGQIRNVLDKTRDAERLEEERRAQNASDDRFLSRLRWSGLAPDPA